MRTIFEISKSGMRSAERSLSVTANNVINADTPGFSRQRVDTTSVGQSLHGLHRGLGVSVTGITRLRNEMVDVQLGRKRQEMGFLQEKVKIYEQLEASLATDSGGDLDIRIGRLFDAFSDLSNDPQDLGVRNNLINEAIQLTIKLGDMDRNLEQISDNTRQLAINSVSEINELLRDLSVLNKSIQVSKAVNTPDYAALDKQVRKLEKLSNLVDIETMTTDNGNLEIRINGIQVLSGEGFRKLVPEVDDISNTFDLRLENGTKVIPTGGKLAAGIEMYEENIQGLKARLDLIAGVLVGEINEIHLEGYGLENNVERSFSDPDFTTAAGIRVNDELVNNHRHIAASSTPGEAGNSDIAVALADLRNERIIDGRKPVDYSVELISDPGSNISRLRTEAGARESEIRMLEVQQEQEAGVNIDEEMSKLIQYQNAYQGAARVMASAQQMYDTLISLVR